MSLPSSEITCPTWGKGKSSTQKCPFCGHMLVPIGGFPVSFSSINLKAVESPAKMPGFRDKYLKPMTTWNSWWIVTKWMSNLRWWKILAGNKSVYIIYIYISHQSDKRNIIDLNIAHPCEGMVVGGAFEGWRWRLQQNVSDIYQTCSNTKYPW